MSNCLSLIDMIVKGAYFRHGKSAINGKGIGAVLLDGGQGGQSSYDSPADWMATIRHGGSVASTAKDIGQHLSTGEPFKNGKHKRPPMSVEWLQHNTGMGLEQPNPTTLPYRPPPARRPVGLGASQIARISSLMMKPTAVKPKAINFSL